MFSPKEILKTYVSHMHFMGIWDQKKKKKKSTFLFTEEKQQQKQTNIAYVPTRGSSLVTGYVSPEIEINKK